MSYDPTIPATGHSASQDYLGIQANFKQINDSFKINHEPLATGGGIDGFHTQVQLAAVLAGDPNKVAPVSSVYTKGTPPELFFQNGALASDVMQITGNLVTEANGQYTVTTPWGITFKFGTMTIVTSGTKVAFSSNFTTGLGCNVTIRQGSGGGFQISALIANDGITIAGTNINGQTAYFFAWGM